MRQYKLGAKLAIQMTFKQFSDDKHNILTKYCISVIYRLEYSWRVAVGERERGKSAAVRVHNRFKRAYRRVGEMATSEGFLSDPDLSYFLTHGEVGQLLSSPPSPTSIMPIRAARRRRAFASAQVWYLPLSPLSFMSWFAERSVTP